jgi:spore coat protein CotF
MYGEYPNGGITNIKPCNMNFLETILQVLVKLKKKVFNMMGDKNFYEGSS